MNDKDFVFDFYIGDDGESNQANTEKTVTGDNAFVTEVESEILLNDFADEEVLLENENEKKNIWVSFKNWWKNRKKWQKATMIAAVAVVLVASIVLSVFNSGVGYNYNKITNDHEDLGIENIIDKDIVNVALFGIDTRNVKSFKGNSDSIMVLSLNTNTKKVKIISLMRDSFVPITYNGKTTYSKINSAYAKGGPELAIKVINTNFGLDITEYATVNFFGMVDIIDAVGGIEAELTAVEVANQYVQPYAINACISEICSSLGVSAKEHYINTAGKQHLNGIQAVAYSRIRYVANIWGTNNDYGRTDRQRYVMEQLFNKALTIEKSQYIKLAKSLIPCTETSLSYSEIIGLAFDMLLESPSFEQARIPRDDMLMIQPKTSAGSVVYYDLEFAKKLIRSFIYDDIDFDQYIEANGVEKNDWYSTVTRRQSSSGTGNNNNSTVSNSTSKPLNESTDESTDESLLESSIDNTISNSTDSSEDKTTSENPLDSDEENTSAESTDSNNENEDTGSFETESGSSSNSSSENDDDQESTSSKGEETSSKEDSTDSDESKTSGSSKPSNTSKPTDESKPDDESKPADESSSIANSASSDTSTDTSSNEENTPSNNVTN